MIDIDVTNGSVSKYELLGYDYHWRWVESGDHPHYAEWIAKILTRFPMQGRGKTILDFGSGSGYPASVLVSRGYRVIGIEPVDGARAIAQARVPDAEFYPRIKGDMIYDYVLGCEVIEHMSNPADLVNAVNHLCRRYAVVTCPNPHLDKWALHHYDDKQFARLFAPAIPHKRFDDGKGHRLFELLPAHTL
jgi:2-polyprenyl-3-methyl-5-hydroxy-6-metoxy-1,4-benzoquinol methylase